MLIRASTGVALALLGAMLATDAGAEDPPRDAAAAELVQPLGPVSFDQPVLLDASAGVLGEQADRWPEAPDAGAVALAPATRNAAVSQYDPALGGDTLNLPADSGSGRRAVFSKSAMRVWLVEADGSLHHTHRVSGRDDQPDVGTYEVFSKSAYTCSNAHPDTCMRYMVRFTKGPDGDNIGFHEIPRRDGEPVQSDEQIGEALSDGCLRQLTADAIVTWEWATVGTVVVVTP